MRPGCTRDPTVENQSRGLTAERFTPALDLAATQFDVLQMWAIGFFNRRGSFYPFIRLVCWLTTMELSLTLSFVAAASILGQVWTDPANPQAGANLLFPEGSVITKTLFTNASDAEVPSMAGAPAWHAASLISACFAE